MNRSGIAGAVVAFAGLVYASLWTVSLDPDVDRVPTRIVVRQAPLARGAEAAAEERRLPIEGKLKRASELPARVDRRQPKKSRSPPIEEFKPPSTLAPEALPAPRVSPPPAPPTEYAPPPERARSERAGGPTLVMALLLNSQGEVLDARILVPSSNPIGDLTYLMSLPGAHLGAPQPPIPLGETRWVELRFRYEQERALLP